MESTTAPPYQLPPIEDAKRQYVELFGSALVMNTYLEIALLCVSVIAVGLLLLNFRMQSKYANVKPWSFGSTRSVALRPCSTTP